MGEKHVPSTRGSGMYDPCADRSRMMQSRAVLCLVRHQKKAVSKEALAKTTALLPATLSSRHPKLSYHSSPTGLPLVVCTISRTSVKLTWTLSFILAPTCTSSNLLKGIIRRRLEVRHHVLHMKPKQIPLMKRSLPGITKKNMDIVSVHPHRNTQLHWVLHQGGRNTLHLRDRRPVEKNMLHRQDHLPRTKNLRLIHLHTTIGHLFPILRCFHRRQHWETR